MVRKPVLSTVSCHCPSFAATSAFTISLPRGDFSRPDMGAARAKKEKQKMLVRRLYRSLSSANLKVECLVLTPPFTLVGPDSIYQISL